MRTRLEQEEGRGRGAIQIRREEEMPPRHSARRRSQPQRYQSDKAEREEQERRNRAGGRQREPQEETSHNWEEGTRFGEADNPGPHPTGMHGLTGPHTHTPRRTQNPTTPTTKPSGPGVTRPRTHVASGAGAKKGSHWGLVAWPNQPCHLVRPTGKHPIRLPHHPKSRQAM